MTSCHSIAIIEDDDAIAQMYKFKLEVCGYVVQLASNGVKGLELCKNFLPDLILLDIRMPEMDGDEMLERLRATDWGSSIRVIVLTNVSKDEAPMRLRLLSVSRYVVKAHYTPAQVVSVVREVLNEKIAKH
jgi:DNA-binding response OmpR family regulator